MFGLSAPCSLEDSPCIGIRPFLSYLCIGRWGFTIFCTVFLVWNAIFIYAFLRILRFCLISAICKNIPFCFLYYRFVLWLCLCHSECLMLKFLLYSLLCNVSCIMFSSLVFASLVIGYVFTLFIKLFDELHELNTRWHYNNTIKDRTNPIHQHEQEGCRA
jgi:hypothetical protein